MSMKLISLVCMHASISPFYEIKNLRKTLHFLYHEFHFTTLYITNSMLVTLSSVYLSLSKVITSSQAIQTWYECIYAWAS